MKKLLVAALLIGLSACTAFHSPPGYLPDASTLTPGETITVQGSENIYTVAHEHNVSMRDLIALNNLKPPYEVRPGQRLVLPAGGASSFSGNSMPAPSAAPLVPVEQNAIAPIEPAGVSSQPLAPIAPAPVSQPPSSMTPQTLGPPSQVAPTVVAPRPMSQAAPVPQQIAPVSDASAPVGVSAGSVASSVNMEWPVQGPILSAYGAKGPGMNNDGINIGAPKGAPVVAAAPGTVVYAGDEMKGFGNLVLIRHQDDWVTAYAHLDRVLVKKDSVVGQGDEIGTVGKTGNVASPQLHFETRHAGKAVDPSGVIKSAL